MSDKGTSIVDFLVGMVIVSAIGAGGYAFMRMDKTGKKSAGLGRQYEKRAKELEKIDPALFTHTEDTGALIASGLKVARAVAVGPKDSVYVAGDGVVRIFTADGARQGEVATGGVPLCLTVDKDGTLFVGFKEQVRVYDAAGKQTAEWDGLGEQARFTSIAVAGDEVFVADAGMRCVHIYTRAGRKSGTIGDPNAGLKTHFKIPSPYFDVAVGPDGVLSVVNPGVHKIERYKLDGQAQTAFGGYGQGIDGFCGCCNPVNMALLPNGHYVTTEKGLTRVKILDTEGALVGVVAGSDAFASHDKTCAAKGDDEGCDAGGLDIAADSKGRVLILDPYTGEVRVFVKQ